MLCPNCNKEMPDGNKCPHCGVDVVVFKKIVKLSDSLYNKGLALAKTSDLTGAASFLEKSVKINKDNVQAYNLLGLVLYEMGHVGDAVKQWVISSNRSQENNPAINYIEELNKNGTVLERYSDAISMYNNALTYIKQKSEDLAIIQLKKAIEINPKFVDALNLLALCYFAGQEKEKASPLVERVLAIDLQNPIALNYYAELHPGRKPANRARKAPGTATPVVTHATPPETAAYMQPVRREKKHVNFHLAEIITFLLGVGCTFAVFYVLIMPALEKETELQVAALETQALTKEQDYFTNIRNKDSEIEERDEEISSLNGSLAEADARYELLRNTNRVYQAVNMLSSGRYQDAVDLAAEIDLVEQPPDIIELHRGINATAYPILAQTYFDEGETAYGEEDYQKALVDLEKASPYVSTDAEYFGDFLYYMGMIYARDEVTWNLAIQYLTKLTETEDYAVSNSRRRNARDMLEDISPEEES